MKKTVKSLLIVYATVSVFVVFFSVLAIVKPAWFGTWAVDFWEETMSESKTVEGFWNRYTRYISIIDATQIGIGIVLGIAGAASITVESTKKVEVNVTVNERKEKRNEIRAQKIKKAAKAVASREVEAADAGVKETTEKKVSTDIETFLNSL